MRTEKTPTQDYTALDEASLSTAADTVAAKLASVRAQIAELSDSCLQLVADERAIADVQAMRKLAANSDKDWPWLLQGEGASDVHYKAAGQALHELCPALNGHNGLQVSGTNIHTNQRVLKVALLKGEPSLTQRVQAALEVVLPYIVPHAYGRDPNVKAKYLTVFERSLSEFGKFFIAIDESAGRYDLLCQRYSSQSVVYAGVSLAALLDYMEKNCYYKSAVPDEEDE
jgi:hypothetical protein